MLIRMTRSLLIATALVAIAGALFPLPGLGGGNDRGSRHDTHWEDD